MERKIMEKQLAAAQQENRALQERVEKLEKALKDVLRECETPDEATLAAWKRGLELVRRALSPNVPATDQARCMYILGYGDSGAIFCGRVMPCEQHAATEVKP